MIGLVYALGLVCPVMFAVGVLDHLLGPRDIDQQWRAPRAELPRAWTVRR